MNVVVSVPTSQSVAHFVVVVVNVDVFFNVAIWKEIEKVKLFLFNLTTRGRLGQFHE